MAQSQSRASAGRYRAAAAKPLETAGDQSKAVAQRQDEISAALNPSRKRIGLPSFAFSEASIWCVDGGEPPVHSQGLTEKPRSVWRPRKAGRITAFEE